MEERELTDQELIRRQKVEKLKELKILLAEYKSNALISVDGGINDITKNKCIGANILVSGSYITNSSNYQEKITSLRK